MKLQYTTGTNYSQTSVATETSFDMDVMFAWADGMDATPKRSQINAKLANLMGLKISAYNKFSELTESVEFKTAADAHNTPNVLALVKNEREEMASRQGPRENNGGITSALKTEIGKQVFDKVMIGVGIDNPADYEITAEFVLNCVKVRDNVELPAKREIKEKTIGKRKQVDMALAGSIRTLHNDFGLTAEQIVEKIPHVDLDQVTEILS